MRKAVWPGVLMTLLTGVGFAGLKFVLIGEIALEFDPATHQPLPIQWMEDIVQACVAKGTLDEAVSQGLAAILTFGVLIGYLFNAPLASAWHCGPLFVLSCAGIAAGTMLSYFSKHWLIAILFGVAYGSACAARGKAIPLIAHVSRRPNTQVSGFINAALVVGLLGGTVLGLGLEDMPNRFSRHLLLTVVMLVATGLSFLVRPPEPAPTPFMVGMRELVGGTIKMMREQWPLLAGGGLSWGIAAAASLAVCIDAIDRLKIPYKAAGTMALPLAFGALAGNLMPARFANRRYVMLSLFCLAIGISAYPWVANSWLSAAFMLFLVGALFAHPANVLDARLLAIAAAEGKPGRGSTVMSLVHNMFILAVGTTLALALFRGVMTPTGQFYALSGVALLTMVVAGFARLRDEEPKLPSSILEAVQ